MLYGSGVTVGSSLVRHPLIKAVGFTGSHKGGRALMDLAAARPEPIPVYAEMSSINPVIMMPDVLAQKAAALADGYFQSLTLGVGQFCTNPGLLLLPKGSESEFVATLKEKISSAASATMLNAGICQAYLESTAATAAHPGVTTIRSNQCAAPGQAAPVVFLCEAETFLSSSALSDEMFGPASLIVTGSTEQLLAIAEAVEGQLTASIFGTEADFASAGVMLEILERKAGRLIFNGFPTGVEVCHSMVHGGPYPATSDGRSTSVGTMAASRFTRPVAWQNTPDALLPDELKESNPLGIPRLIDGKLH